MNYILQMHFTELFSCLINCANANSFAFSDAFSLIN